MAGTIEGGRRAAETNKLRYGKDFYARIGAKGGRNGRTGGFYANRELARIAGAKGGAKSRRGKRVPNPGSDQAIAKGCTCPVSDNDYGRGGYVINGHPAFWLDAYCPPSRHRGE